MKGHSYRAYDTYTRVELAFTFEEFETLLRAVETATRAEPPQSEEAERMLALVNDLRHVHSDIRRRALDRFPEKVHVDMTQQ